MGIEEKNMNFFEKIKAMDQQEHWDDWETGKGKDYGMLEAKCGLYWKYYNVMVRPLRDILRW